MAATTSLRAASAEAVRVPLLSDGRGLTKRFRLRVAAEGQWAIGYHMPFPAVGWVDKTGEGYCWVPLDYQPTL